MYRRLRHRQARIDSREALPDAQESGEIQRGNLSSIGVTKRLGICSCVEVSRRI